MRLVRSLVAGGLVLLFAGCPEIREASPADLPSGEEIVGAWEAPAAGALPEQRIHFLDDGRFLVDEGANGVLENVGRWSIEEDNRLIVAYWEWSEFCPLVPGAYEFSVENGELALRAILDECEARRLSWERNLSRVEAPRVGSE